MFPNELGRWIDRYWQDLDIRFPGVRVDEHVVMPNHFHGIVGIPDPDVSGRMALPVMMQWWKSITTGKYRCLTGTGHKLWQRSYYERVIRNEREYGMITEYIRTNPERWREDAYYTP